MEKNSFMKTIEALAGNFAFPILRTLNEKGWCIASDISKEIGIHITTASKHLSKLYEAGILERRLRDSKPRKAFEYRLLSPRIAVELDLREGGEEREGEIGAFYLSLLEGIVEKTKKLGCPFVEERILSLGQELEKAAGFSNTKSETAFKEKDLKTIRQLANFFANENSKESSSRRKVFLQFLKEVLAVCREEMGEVASKRILELSLKEASKGREELIERFSLAKDLEKD